MSPRGRSLTDDAARTLLSSRGLRVTEQRLAVVRELSRTRAPVSHPELTERLSGTGLDRATVYRNLLTLTEAGLLVRTQLGDGVWRFELPRDTGAAHGEHAHFVCNDCGDVSCLPDDAVAVKSRTVRSHVTEVQLRGRCATCADG
jgi:Fur family ferric uptake transcriptional regulator